MHHTQSTEPVTDVTDEETETTDPAASVTETEAVVARMRAAGASRRDIARYHLGRFGTEAGRRRTAG